MYRVKIHCQDLEAPADPLRRRLLVCLAAFGLDGGGFGRTHESMGTSVELPRSVLAVARRLPVPDPGLSCLLAGSENAGCT